MGHWLCSGSWGQGIADGVPALIAAGLPSHKLILQPPWRGQVFACCGPTGGECVSPGTAIKKGRSQTPYFEVYHYQVARKLAAGLCKSRFSNATGTPYADCKMGSWKDEGARHWGGNGEPTIGNSSCPSQVWFESPQSIQLKYDVADKHNLLGVGAYVVDSVAAEPADPDAEAFWSTLAAFTAGGRVAPSHVSPEAVRAHLEPKEHQGSPAHSV